VRLCYKYVVVSSGNKNILSAKSSEIDQETFVRGKLIRCTSNDRGEYVTQPSTIK